jgi:hypothetical protein
MRSSGEKRSNTFSTTAEEEEAEAEAEEAEAEEAEAEAEAEEAEEEEEEGGVGGHMIGMLCVLLRYMCTACGADQSHSSMKAITLKVASALILVIPTTLRKSSITSYKAESHMQRGREKCVRMGVGECE